MVVEETSVKETFKFYPRLFLEVGVRYCEFARCGHPAEFFAEGDQGSVLWSCKEHAKNGGSQ